LQAIGIWDCYGHADDAGVIGWGAVAGPSPAVTLHATPQAASPAEKILQCIKEELHVARTTAHAFEIKVRFSNACQPCTEVSVDSYAVSLRGSQLHMQLRGRVERGSFHQMWW
jgi:hypothetical protein